ncbi:MAG: hypothetical protein ACTSXL_03665 [Alphaproteobacteria bacterium]
MKKLSIITLLTILTGCAIGADNSWDSIFCTTKQISLIKEIRKSGYVKEDVAY